MQLFQYIKETKDDLEIQQNVANLCLCAWRDENVDGVDFVHLKLTLIMFSPAIRTFKTKHSEIMTVVSDVCIYYSNTAGLETNWNFPLASRASDLENLLALLNSTSPDFFPTTNFCVAQGHWMLIIMK